jgi:hypothetical protein
MKTPTLFFTALLMTGSLAALVADKTAHAFILRDDLTAGSYCYVSLPANQRKSLALEEAFLKKQEPTVSLISTVSVTRVPFSNITSQPAVGSANSGPSKTPLSRKFMCW